jgi:large subunit ribosomal protein L30e
MVSLTDTIQEAVKKGRVVLGYKESVKIIKSGKPNMVIIANNLPDVMKKEIEYNAKLAKIKIEVFDGSSKDLGVVCGKPFPVTILTIE